MKKETKIISYKGFDKNLKCRDFQYAIGKNHAHDGNAEVCKNGFHSCEYPLDVFKYYPPSTSRFAVVEAVGDISRESNGDSKIASKSLTIKAEIGTAGLVKAAIEYTTLNCKITKSKKASNTGDYSAASNTGYQSAASVSGKSSVAMASGKESKAKACQGSAIVLCAYDKDGNLTYIKSAIAGIGEIKADVWYTLTTSGEFLEVTE